MKLKSVLTMFSLAAVLLAAGAIRAVAQSDKLPPIDPVGGRQLMQKASRGEKLTDEEQAYLKRVKQAIRGRAANWPKPKIGAKLSDSPLLRRKRVNALVAFGP